MQDVVAHSTRLLLTWSDNAYIPNKVSRLGSRESERADSPRGLRSLFQSFTLVAFLS